MARTNALAFVGTNYTLSKNCHSDGETERKRYDLAEEKPLKSNKQTNKQKNGIRIEWQGLMPIKSCVKKNEAKQSLTAIKYLLNE